jgi:hypothetical protein
LLIRCDREEKEEDRGRRVLGLPREDQVEFFLLLDVGVDGKIPESGLGEKFACEL